eukprot:3732650-Heterocapsa_arctica.AAC.1
MRSLQGGTKPNVKQAAGWMITHGVSEADIRGQSGWVQAINSWCPLLIIGCLVPHFLRKVLPPGLGEGVTGASLASCKEGPR